MILYVLGVSHRHGSNNLFYVYGTYTCNRSDSLSVATCGNNVPSAQRYKRMLCFLREAIGPNQCYWYRQFRRTAWVFRSSEESQLFHRETFYTGKVSKQFFLLCHAHFFQHIKFPVS